MTNQNNPPIQRRLFYCPGQRRFFWVKYEQGSQKYTYGDEVMTLAKITKTLKVQLVPERRFWDGPNNEHVMLPFNKARGRAFYLGKWQTLDILRALDVKEAPLVQQLPPATARFAPGAEPKGVFTSHKYARSKKKS